ncbi:chitinase [Stenotrophomonas sp. ATCM1_4]|uniref:glycosyl hydrolase family 18 protein n=1 Tax=Stenotrophomonas sp. ATCM1_4 TaxID=2259330 RepID=UPI0010467CAE|nr:chitinase [Stenotrophomonas sp. ATCM1_4]
MTDHPNHRPPHRRRRTRTGLLLATVMGLAALPAAQAADCTGVKPWIATTIYSPGQTLQKDGVLYQVQQQIWNAAPDHPAGRRYYRSLGRCGSGAGNPPPPSPPPANQAPQVRLTAPSAGSRFAAGSTVTLRADASDRDGSIRKVEFFHDGRSLGVAPQAPYTLQWQAVPAGTHVLSALATDDRNASTRSATVTLIVPPAPHEDRDTTAPTVPAAMSAQALDPNRVQLRWNPSSDNPGGSGLADYDLYRDDRLVASPSTPSYLDSGLAPDTAYRYAVRARDVAGNASARSTPVGVRTPSADTDGDGPGARRLIGYFTQWGIYGRNYKVKQIDSSGSAAKLTHINYAFGNVRNNRCEVGITQAANPGTGSGGDAYADYTRSFGAAESVSGRGDTWNQPLRGNWNQLRQLKAKHPHLKVLISLGGWTWSRGFSSAAQPENRAAFVASCIDAYIKGNLPFTDNAGGPGVAAGIFDGIDVDWEYPADRQNFTALLAEFRRQLDAVRPGMLLTVAVGAGIDKIRVTDPGEYHRYLDFINVMTYDFHGAWAPRTNHHSALFDSPADPSSGDERLYNSNDAIEAYLARGVPAHKLNLGVGFYGRGWTNVAPTNNGLYQPGRPAAGRYEAGIEDWKVLKDLGWPAYRDPAAKAAWIYNSTTFWSFDTPEMLIEKMAYVKAQGLGGAFFWEFSGDDAQGTMVNALDRGLK